MSEELDPSEFVQRIRQLGAERDSQDAERVRKLEAEIIQGRSERLARRAERARSLSPDKPSTPTPQSLRSSTNTPLEVQEKAAELSTPTMNPPTQQSARDESLDALTGSPAQAIEDLEPRKPTPNAAALGRKPTLSWQQRPQSGGSIRRPISRSTSPNKSSPRDTPEPSSPATSTLSRSQIAENLGSKSPDWFKQTQDRGIGSAALRKNQEHDAGDAEPAFGKRQLPGMSRDSKSSFESSSPPRADSGRGSVRLSANTPIIGANDEPARASKSPLPQLESQKFAFPSLPLEQDEEDEAASGRALAMSPTQGRISPVRTERPASPTKGMGGFVQSAMLKRSDSVSKRWSTQAPQGLTRQNSTISNRGSVAPSSYSTLSKSDARRGTVSNDKSMEPSSRPGSSSSNLAMTKDALDKEEHDFVKPARPYHSRSKSVASTFSQSKKSQDEPQEETSPPSPSKRWSPTKSSWLESALKRPESPKPMLPPPQQPAWMAEINRAKQQRGSVDLGKDGPFHSMHADPPGSGRTSPFKEVQLRPAGLRRAESQSPTKDLSSGFRRPESPFKDDFRGFRRPESPKKDESSEFRRPESPKKEESAGLRRSASPAKDDFASLRKFEPPKTTESAMLPKRDLLKEEVSTEPLQPSPKSKPILSPKPSTIGTKQFDESLPSKISREAVMEDPPQADPKPSLSTARFSKDSSSPAPLVKAKPDVPPTKDLRGTLRSRQGPPGTSDAPKKDSVNELANVFGRLKKTETKNYVAPDLLKDNILRGKHGLALTGGPKPTARRDEFRDSIVTKKAAMLAKAEEVGSAAHKRADSSSDPPPMPEAIARRKTLSGRSGSISNLLLEKEPAATPEAISRQKSLRLSKQASPEKSEGPTTSGDSTKEPPKSNKFADRFNPALAGLLARGPPAPTANISSSGGGSSEATTSSQEEKKGPAPELTHITKGRARGPKRRAPAAKQAVTGPDSAPQKVAPAAAVPLVMAEHILPSNEDSKTDITLEERPVIRKPARESFKAKPATAIKPSVEPPVIRSVSRESFKAKVATPSKSSTEPPMLRSASRESFKAKVATPIKSSVEPPMIRSASRESFKAQPPTPLRTSVDSPVIRSVSRDSTNAKLATPIKISEESITRTASRESFKARLGAPSPPSEESPIARTLSRESFKTMSATPSRMSGDSPVARSSARESLTPKPATPAKSPDLSRRLDKSPSPELPRKPIALESNRKASSDLQITLRKPTDPIASEPAKPASPSSRVSMFRSSRPLPTPPPKPETRNEPSPALQEIASPNPVVPPKDDVPTPEKSSFSVRSASALWSRQSAPSPTSTKPKSPIKLPTRADEEALMENAGLARSPDPVQAKPQTQKPKPKPVGLGLGSLGSFGGLVAGRARVSSPSEQKALPATPPATGDLRPQSEPFKPSPIIPKPDDLFGNFFDELPVTSGELPENINSLEILQNPPLDPGPTGKIRTIRNQIQEITGDGKLSAVPMQEEHILYQDSMYICTHVFGDSKGARTTEVYLWSGNGVAEATLEDAQLFGRNIAKQNQGKLVMLRQGKETPNFFEALGGIVLTRRGSRPASKEYMLCGRRHLGHIAFDEVDFSLKSLCSGFTYIISTEAGKLGKIFLWKGRGCSQEEVSGARLMGMDLTLTGELVEIDEGSESPDLFAALPPNEASVASNGKLPPIPRSADHWRYKATSEKYRARLFKIEQQQGSLGWGQGLQVSSFIPPLLRRPSWGMFATTPEKPTEPPQTPSTPRSPLPPTTTKVVEIMPFCQRDLEPEYIYVLDAFFDIYIIVGALSRSQSAAFSTALLFAQEYSILAVSEDDRPFMPVTTVVLEGIPKDMKSVFRFWDDNLIPTAGLMSGKLGRGRSLKLVGLEKAIAATRR